MQQNNVFLIFETESEFNYLFQATYGTCQICLIRSCIGMKPTYLQTNTCMSKQNNRLTIFDKMYELHNLKLITILKMLL